MIFAVAFENLCGGMALRLSLLFSWLYATKNTARLNSLFSHLYRHSAGVDISELGLCHQYNRLGDVFLYYNTDCPSRPVASLEAEARSGQFEKLIVDSCQLLALARSYSSRFLLFAFHYQYAYGLFSIFRGLKTRKPGLPTIYVRNS